MNEQKDTPEVQKALALTGFAILACIAVFIASVLAAFVAWGNSEWSGGGTCLVAAAISAGFLLNSMAQR